VMGDFNSAPWSPMQGAFRAATGLENRGHLRLTWPTWVWPVLRVPIDQVFVRGKVAVAGIETGPDANSDHMPIVAEIVVGP